MKNKLSFLFRPKSNIKNPFFNSFLRFALISSLALGIAFLFLAGDRENQMESFYNQEKLDYLKQDFDLQLNNLEDIALRLSINQKYHYSVISAEKYNENILLSDFKNYQFSSILTRDMFVYYPGMNRIFHVTDSTIHLNVYLRNLSEDQYSLIMDALNNPDRGTQILSTGSELYILTPFKVGSSNFPNAILGAVVKNEKLTQRFETISGGLHGTIALYCDDSLLYSNLTADKIDNTLWENSETLRSLFSTKKAELQFRYLPDANRFMLQFSLVQISLIIVDFFLILLIVFLFANRAFIPLRNVYEKYQDKLSPDRNKTYASALRELETLIDDSLQKSALTTTQITQIQEMMKQQLIQHLLNGTCPPNIGECLDKLGILLQGPFFYVICIAYEAENVTEEFWHVLTDELEKINTPYETERIYAIYDTTKGQLWALCSLENRDHEQEMTEYVIDVAESYSYIPTVGIGKVYGNLTQMSASWLESIDNLGKNTVPVSSTNTPFFFKTDTMSRLINSLSVGALDIAMTCLDDFVNHSRSAEPSLLMQRYIFAEFVGAISKLSRTNQIELSNQSVSLLITAKDIDSFHNAAKELITEYCNHYHSLQKFRKQEEARQICNYINDHFKDYDISIESVSEALHVSIVTVREAVMDNTGYLYKDYITYLRMEYAKKLLQENEISVAEACSAVGYSSVSYFIRLFKECTGVTPAKYMKNFSSVR